MKALLWFTLYNSSSVPAFFNIHYWSFHNCTGPHFQRWFEFYSDSKMDSFNLARYT